MFTSITVAQVRHIADLAERATDAHRRLIGGLRDVDPGRRGDERHRSAPLDLDALGLLDQTADHRALDDLRAAIGGLDAAARQELKATAMVGEGAFAPGEWERAMTAAAAIPAGTDQDHLTDTVALHDRLTKALYELKCL